MLFQEGFDIKVPEQTLTAISELEKHSQTIMQECLAIDTAELTVHSPENLRSVDEYRSLKIYGLHYKFKEHLMHEGHRDNFKETLKFIQTIPDVCNVYFSISEPGCDTVNHSDNTPFTFKISLSIKIPDYCGFDINGKIYDIPEGEIIVWDSCIPHKVWNNNNSQHRIVLIMDILRPGHRKDEILNPSTVSPKDNFEVHD